MKKFFWTSFTVCAHSSRHTSKIKTYIFLLNKNNCYECNRNYNLDRKEYLKHGLFFKKQKWIEGIQNRKNCNGNYKIYASLNFISNIRNNENRINNCSKEIEYNSINDKTCQSKKDKIKRKWEYFENWSNNNIQSSENYSSENICFKCCKWCIRTIITSQNDSWLNS